MVYDEANRISSAAATGGGIEAYGYLADSKTVYKYTSVGTEQLTFFGARRERSWGFIRWRVRDLRFHRFRRISGLQGRRSWMSNEPAYMDLLGTNREGYENGIFQWHRDALLPVWGGDHLTANEHEKFATYTRDDYTLLDYADQRYLMPRRMGGFNTADPARAAARQEIR